MVSKVAGIERPTRHFPAHVYVSLPAQDFRVYRRSHRPQLALCNSFVYRELVCGASGHSLAIITATPAIGWN
jgi:hypothetical protein